MIGWDEDKYFIGIPLQMRNATGSAVVYIYGYTACSSVYLVIRTYAMITYLFPI